MINKSKLAAILEDEGLIKTASNLWKRFEKEYLKLAKDLSKDRYFKEDVADTDPDDLMEVLKEKLEEAQPHRALDELMAEMDEELGDWVEDRKYKDIEKAALRVLSDSL